ncbi:hypothetical protein BH09PLA1_BH09PLA1_07500 [soil metagenome]
MIATLALLCTAIAVGRLRFVHDFPDWDVATYTLIGAEMSGGERLYADVWDMKPPGIFASFAIAEWITRGSHEWSAYVLSTLAAMTTTIAIYFAAAALAGCGQLTVAFALDEQRGGQPSRSIGLWAAAIWTCVSLQPALGGPLPNTEAFINALLAIAIAAAISRRLIIAGAALAIASLFKQVAIAPALAIAIWLYFAGNGSRPRAAIRSAAMVAAIPLAWPILGAYFAVTDRGDLFYQTNCVYSRFYGGSVVANLLSAFEPSHLFPRAMIELLPLVLLAGVGIAISSHRPLLIALVFGSWIAVALPGRFFEHYYQLWLVPLSLAGACAIASMQRRLAVAVGSIVCIGLLILQAHWWVLAPRDRAAALHPASTFLYVTDVGTELRTILRSDETMFAWCDEPQLYWLARKHPPTVGLWKQHLTEGPMSKSLARQTLAALQRNPPDLVAASAGDIDASGEPIARWIAENYIALPNNATRFPLAIYARKGSDLSRRAAPALP